MYNMKAERKTKETEESAESIGIQYSTENFIRPKADSCKPKYSEIILSSIPAMVSPLDAQSLSDIFMPHRHTSDPYTQHH